MDFEQDMTIAEFGIFLPDRCRSCTRLGGLITKLSQAHDNKNYLFTITDAGTFNATVRAQLTEQTWNRYPNASNEGVAQLVDNSMSKYFNNEKFVQFLEQSGQELEAEEATIVETLAQVQTLTSNCPPAGFGS